MEYTEEQIKLFEKMFQINSEYTTYTSYELKKNGLRESEIGDRSYNTGQAYITLSNGKVYIIDYGISDDAEGFAMNAFREFIAMNYDEEKFEQYLIAETPFQED